MRGDGDGTGGVVAARVVPAGRSAGTVAPAAALPGLATRLGTRGHRRAPFRTQVLIQTPIACGGLAECGVCAVQARRGWKMACKNGPVFELEELI